MVIAPVMRQFILRRIFLVFACCGCILFADAQTSLNQRTFPQSKTAVEKALKSLQPSTSGRLPVVDGFAVPGDRPLDRFQRGYYECKVQVTPSPAGGSLVKVDAKITAWYADPVVAHSGYQVLTSNGRIEGDLLDRLSAALAGNGQPGTSAAGLPRQSESSAANKAEISAPMPRLPDSVLRGQAVDSSSTDSPGSLKSETEAAERHEQNLAEEAKGLEEILQNQSHPTNLVAVRKTGTPILQAPNAEAKVLFAATAGDEFEVLDVNSNWVHVRISGLSRGWIRRASLEMPDELSDSTSSNPSGADQGAEFRVSNEQLAPFPGDWDPLRGKIVKIVTAQKTADNSKTGGPQAKLEFAKVLLKKQYSELAASTEAPAGVVLIFDSNDGGMVAATMATLKAWQAGSLSDQAAWRQFFFDPPELLGNLGAAGTDSVEHP